MYPTIAEDGYYERLSACIAWKAEKDRKESDKSNMHMHDQARHIGLVDGGDIKWEARDQKRRRCKFCSQMRNCRLRPLCSSLLQFLLHQHGSVRFSSAHSLCDLGCKVDPLMSTTQPQARQCETRPRASL